MLVLLLKTCVIFLNFIVVGLMQVFLGCVINFLNDC